MSAYHVEEFFHLDMLVMRPHAMRVWTVNEGRDVAVAPQPGIGAAETDDRHRPRPASFNDVALQNAHHFMIGVAPGRLVTADFLPGHFWIASSNLVYCGQDIGLFHSDRQPEIRHERTMRWNHIRFVATLDQPDVQGDLGDKIPGALPHHSIHDLAAGIDRLPDIVARPTFHPR